MTRKSNYDADQLRVQADELTALSQLAADPAIAAEMTALAAHYRALASHKDAKAARRAHAGALPASLRNRGRGDGGDS